MLNAETNNGQMPMPGREDSDKLHADLMQKQREESFRNARRHLTESVTYEDEAGSIEQEIADMQSQMDSMSAGEPKGLLRLKKETATQNLNKNKQKAEIAVNSAITDYAFWKGVKLHVEYLSGIGSDGTEHKAIRYTVDGDDDQGTQTTKLFEDFDRFTEQHRDWLTDEDDLERPEDWPKEKDDEAIAKRERAKKPLNPDLLIKADQDTVLKSPAALEAAEYFLVGLMLSSSFNTKFFGLNQKNLSLESSVEVERKLAEIRQSLSHKDAVEELTSSDVILLRNTAIERAGHHLTALRNANILPEGFTAKDSKTFLQQVRKSLALVQWKRERKANIDLLRQIILNTREYNQKAGNLGETTVGHEIAEQ